MNKLKLPLAVFVIWVVASSVYLYVWAFTDYGYFDEQNQWLGLTEMAPAQTKLLTYFDLSEVASVNQRLLVHIRETGCRCNAYADQHADDLLADVQGQQITLTVAEANALNISVPATPMVAVFQLKESTAKLIYAGPYASGPFCSADDSFLPAVLGGGLDISGPWLNGGVKACRCVVTNE
ncbi:MAG TPA: DUF6436 domain-containing protein [Aliidiomarina sp.]|nr:DUF6436 domain-containing protein [Aliidiomarina sp.]